MEGIDFKGYLRERAALKAREYNLAYPGIEAKRQKVLSETVKTGYRKYKDGE